MDQATHIMALQARENSQRNEHYTIDHGQQHSTEHVNNHTTFISFIVYLGLLAIKFYTSGGFGTTLLTWMYNYLTGRHPIGADSLASVLHKLRSNTKEISYHKLLKAVLVANASGSLLVISGAIFAGTVIALAVVSPLVVLFSPVLVALVIMVLVLVSGVLGFGGFSVVGSMVMVWVYKLVTGGYSGGSGSWLDQGSDKVDLRATEMWEHHASEGVY